MNVNFGESLFTRNKTSILTCQHYTTRPPTAIKKEPTRWHNSVVDDDGRRAHRQRITFYIMTNHLLTSTHIYLEKSELPYVRSKMHIDIDDT